MFRAIASRSFFCRAFQNSAMYTCWEAISPTPSIFRSSIILRGFNATAIPQAVLAGCVLCLALFGLLAGRIDLIIFAGFAITAYALPCVALACLPAALLWSPRLGLLGMGNEPLFLRLDHALLAGVLCHLSVAKKHRFREHPLYIPMAIFLIALILSAIVGALRGTIPMPTGALLYCAQWAHLMLLFVAAYSLGVKLGTAGIYAWGLGGVSIAVYGLCESTWPYFEPYNVVYRTYERVLFDGQANHYAGFHVLATVIGLALARERRFRVFGVLIALLATGALYTTGSRTGWIAWAAALAVLIVLWFPRLKYVTLPGLLIVLLAIPDTWWYRASAPGSSMFDRLVAWKSALSTFPVHPLLGLGVGARHRSYYDSQYFMTLAESGLVGLVLLLLLIVTLGRALRPDRAEQGLHRALCTGALAALAGACVHSFAAVSFVITVVAGPLFWWCGYALSQRRDNEAA